MSLPTTIYCTHIYVGYNIQRGMSKFNDFLALVKQAGKIRLKRLKTEGLRIVPPVVVVNHRSLTIIGQTTVFPGSWRFPGNGCVRPPQVDRGWACKCAALRNKILAHPL